MYNSVRPSVIKKGVMPFELRGVLLSYIEGMILWHLEKQRDLFNIPFGICMLEDQDLRKSQYRCNRFS